MSNERAREEASECGCRRGAREQRGDKGRERERQREGDRGRDRERERQSKKEMVKGDTRKCYLYH